MASVHTRFETYPRYYGLAFLEPLIESILRRWEQATKLHGNTFEDALALKYAHQRYSSYRRWLELR